MRTSSISSTLVVHIVLEVQIDDSFLGLREDSQSSGVVVAEIMTAAARSVVEASRRARTVGAIV